MTRLGYARYGAQGGDWGSAVSRELGSLDAQRAVGIHLNFFMTTPPAEFSGPQSLSAQDRAALATVERFRTQRSGYYHVQATRPHTLGYALTDSPVGQLAWIADKFMEWTGSRDRPEEAIDRDLLLTNVMLYWLTRTAGSSARLYYEYARAVPTAAGPTVPTAVAVFPDDLVRPVRAWAERVANIVRWTEFEQGGHFPALEVPHLLIDDVRAFFRPLRPRPQG
jgi:pimeloyl-ACP methyl ester carboxylesterase